MAQRADSKSVAKLLRDRELLPYTDAEIARRIGMDRSNFSSYVNGHLPITRSFLRRFYSIFGAEVEGLRTKGASALEAIGMKERMDAIEKQLNWLTAEVRKMKEDGEPPGSTGEHREYRSEKMAL